VAQVCELTDLFIELSNERCQEQREICEEYQTDGFNIATAHLPEID